MNDVVMEVNNPKEYITALSLARNAFLDNVSICVNNMRGDFSHIITKDIQDGIKGLFSANYGFFPAAQTRSYSSRILFNPLGLIANVHLNALYMSSEKERNDFNCIAAEISELLIEKCGFYTSDMSRIVAFTNWIRKYFVYRNTDNYQDHSAAELLKNRTGVCQAIAALAVVVLPYMGIRTQYVAGQGNGNGSWGNHAWNIVCINGEWIHVDFTFALNSIGIPMTSNIISTKMFRANHKWDENAFSTDAIEARHYMNDSISKGEIVLYKNQEFLMINEVKIHTKFPIYYEYNNQDYIKFYDLLKYLGGGCEIDLEKNQIRICVADKVYLIPATDNIVECQTGGINKRSLEIADINNVEINGKLMFRFV